MNRKNKSFIASLLLLVLFGVFTGCRETPINNNPVPRGRQFVGEINGVVRNGNTGAPLSGVTLRLVGPDGDVTATTNADGIYVFRNLQAGTYKIAAVPPAGFAATRVQDVELRDDANNTSTGVAVVRVARDVRFFQANASVAGLIQLRSPSGQLLRAPVGSPVFIDFTRPTGDNPEGRTIGDVQVAEVVGTVRADTVIGGQVANFFFTGLPAVGSLADVDGPVRLIVPNIVSGGVVYGGASGRALTVNITGLRPGQFSRIEPGELIMNAQVGPTQLLATSNAPGGVSAAAFGTTDTITIVFSKPMRPATVQATITRTRTPYSQLGLATLTGVTTTPLPAGTYLGISAAANQAYRITLNRPFVTGSEHEIDFAGTVQAADGSTYTPGTADRALRTFTTRTGLRLLSVTVGGVSVPNAPIVAQGVPTSGTVNITVAVPTGASIRPVILRGPNRNLELRTGHTLDGDTLASGNIPTQPPGPALPTVDRDTASVTGGNTITFGYAGLTAGGTPNPVSGATGSPAHIAPVNVTPADPAGDETPLLASLGGPTTTYNRVRGNIASTVPGDFGIGRTNTFNDPNGEYNLVRLFETAIGTQVTPIQILSRPTTNVPTDTVIRIRFSRAITLAAGDTLRNDGHTGGRVRFFRAGPGVPSGPATVTLGTAPTVPNPYARTATNVSGGDSVTAQALGFSASLEEGGTVLALRRLRRLSDNQILPLETGTTYAVELQIAGVATGTGGGVTTLTNVIRLFFSTVPATSVAAASPTEAIPGGTAQPGAPTTGQISITFSRPLAQDVQFFTRGVGANIALLDVGASSAPIPAPPTGAQVDSIREQATLGLPPGFGLPPGSIDNQRVFTEIDCVGVISADRRTVTFEYKNLPANRRFRVISFRPNTLPGTQAPRVFTTVGGIAPDGVPGVIRSAIPGDLGVGGTNSVYLNAVNFTFTTAQQAPTPVFVVSSNASGNLNFDTEDEIQITFSREMRRALSGFRVVRQTSPYTHSTGLATLAFGSGLDTLRWSPDGRTVTIRRTVVSDTARPFDAGTIYRIEVDNADSIQAIDGGALTGFFGIAFQTLPRTRITKAFVAALNGTNERSITGDDNATSINAATTNRFADTAGRIVMLFNQPLRGQYKVRGSESRFFFNLLDTTNARNLNLNINLLPFENTGPTTDGQIIGGDSLRSAFIDSIATIDGNRLFVRYYVSKRMIYGRGIRSGIQNPNAGDTTYIVRFRPNMITASDAAAPVRVIDDLTRTNTSITQVRPNTLRGRSGDFGVVRVDTTTTVTEKISTIRPSGDAFDLKFAIRSGGPGPSAFPDFLVNAVRNTTETVTEAAQKTVSTVRSWWNRFRGE